MDLGMGEILLILLFALLVYGGRLPEVARSIGKSVGAIRKNLQDAGADVRGHVRSVAAEVEDLDDRPRTVRRATPAPRELATEDVSAPPAETTPPPSAADAPPA